MGPVAAALRDPQVIARMGAPTGEHFLAFTSFLADRLDGHDLLPLGFLVCVDLACMDLAAGTCGYTGQPIRNKVVGLPLMLIQMMRMFLDRHLHLVLPEPFLLEVRAAQARVREGVPA